MSFKRRSALFMWLGNVLNLLGLAVWFALLPALGLLGWAEGGWWLPVSVIGHLSTYILLLALLSFLIYTLPRRREDRRLNAEWAAELRRIEAENERWNNLRRVRDAEAQKELP